MSAVAAHNVIAIEGPPALPLGGPAAPIYVWCWGTFLVCFVVCSEFRGFVLCWFVWLVVGGMWRFGLGVVCVVGRRWCVRFGGLGVWFLRGWSFIIVGCFRMVGGIRRVIWCMCVMCVISGFMGVRGLRGLWRLMLWGCCFRGIRGGRGGGWISGENCRVG